VGRTRIDETKAPRQISFAPPTVCRAALVAMAKKETGGNVSDMMRAIIYEAAVRRGVVKKRRGRGVVSYELVEG
jgi:hypothetical protein